jgi:hypothetical protein
MWKMREMFGRCNLVIMAFVMLQDLIITKVQADQCLYTCYKLAIDSTNIILDSTNITYDGTYIIFNGTN